MQLVVCEKGNENSPYRIPGVNLKSPSQTGNVHSYIYRLPSINKVIIIIIIMYFLILCSLRTKMLTFLMKYEGKVYILILSFN